MFGINVPAIVYGINCILKPSRLLPTITIDEFSDLPTDLSTALSRRGEKVDIRAIVLDKDNCFAQAGTTDVWPKYQARWKQLRQEYPGSRVLIVSNSAGTLDDRNHEEANLLSRKLDVDVLLHDVKKPGCGEQIMDHLKAKMDVSPRQVVVIGDRLFTDVLLANNMGAYSIWIRIGAVKDTGFLSTFERSFHKFMT